MESPYIEGGGIILTVQATSHQYYINARIVKVFVPSTLSAVMVVRLSSTCQDLDLDPDLQGDVLLKVYDRRCATSDRESLGIEPWTLNVEARYQEFVRSGEESAFIRRLESDPDFLDREGEAWNVARNECWYNHKMGSFYRTEKEVYRRAHDLQGHDVPRFLLHGSLTSTFSDDLPDFQCQWILLQFIPGFSLKELASHAPREHWQYIGDEAIRIVHAIGSLDILNQDVQLWNFIVRWDTVANKFKVVMIDFALATFREEVESEVEWRKLKAIQDEEGAVGYLLQRHLSPDFVYRRSDEYNQLDTDFKSE